MSDLGTLLKLRLTQGLKRASITSCSKWAEQYRVMGKPFPGLFSYKYHPWLRGMHDANAPMLVGQKSAQAGYTEWALNTAFYNIDMLGNSVLYVLPSQTPDASDFSASRFDPALELSQHLRNLFSDVKNVGHKRAGSANLFIRGSRSRSQLKSIPAAILIFDELDEMPPGAVTLGMARSDGQHEEDTRALLLSTPTIEDKGINFYFKNTTQEHFFFKCPCCSRMTELVFPECLIVVEDNIRESHIICKECKNKLKHEEKHIFLQNNEWVPQKPGNINRGFHINQLYSSTVPPWKLAVKWKAAQTNQLDEQEFWNSNMGLPRSPEGATLTDEQIVKCMTGPPNESKPESRLVTMGVDVGRKLHITIDEWKLPRDYLGGDVNVEALARTIFIGTRSEFYDLDQLMYDYNVTMCVIDAQPERRYAYEFATRNFGRVKTCFYVEGIRTKQIKINSQYADHGINVDRTAWLDLSLGRIRSGRIILPRNTPNEYIEHLQALVKIYKRDHMDNPIARYEHKENRDDHYAHARNYSEIALQVAAGSGVHSTIQESVL